RIAALIALVDSSGLKKGPEKGLITLLTDARAAVAAGDTGTCCGALASFRQRLTKLASHGLTITQAFELDRDVADVQLGLGCRVVAAGGAPTLLETPTAFAFGLGAGVGLSARAELALPVATDVRLEVFDVNGRHVDTAFAGPLDAGTHEIAWTGRGDS